MSTEPSVSVGDAETEYACRCGWRSGETELTDWDVQREYDRVVRVCPDCEMSVPEWGCLAPIDAVVRIARSDLADALERQGIDVS